MNSKLRALTGMLLALLVTPVSAQFRSVDRAIEEYERAKLAAELEMLRQPLFFEPGRAATDPFPGTNGLTAAAADWEMRAANELPSSVRQNDWNSDVWHRESWGEDVPETAGFVITGPASDSFPKVQLGGFFQADAVFATQDGNNRATLGDIQNAADFRRARLLATGSVAENVDFMIEFDFAFPGRPSFMDVRLDAIDTLPFGDLTVGHFRQPIGMDILTSAREMTFLERGLPSAFLPFRQIGVALHESDVSGRWTWAISGYRFPTDVFGGNVGDNGGFGFAGRSTWLPFWSGDPARLLHLGVAYSVASPANNSVRFQAQPEIFVAETGGASLAPPGVPSTIPPFVDTGNLPTDVFGLLDFECAGVLGSLHYQSEVVFANVTRQGGGQANFFGAYAQAGYLLTGEVRPYRHDEGVLGRITPLCPVRKHGGWGAWEVAARWSYLDLNDGATLGGRLNNLTGGLNWYWNRNTKFQFNYIQAFLADAGQGDSAAGFWTCRAQIDF